MIDGEKRERKKVKGEEKGKEKKKKVHGRIELRKERGTKNAKGEKKCPWKAPSGSVAVN